MREWLEQFAQAFGRDAGAGIADINAQRCQVIAIVLKPDIDTDRTPFRKLHGIADKIEQDLPQACRVRQDPSVQTAGFGHQFERNSLLSRIGLEKVDA